MTGNPGHRQIPDTPDVVPAVPACPPHLSGAARIEWDRITAELLVAQLVTQLDMAALVMYCEAWGEYVLAREMLLRPADQGGGYIVKTPNGYEVQSPWVAIANKAAEKMLKAGTEFGLTPSSRARVLGGPQLPLFPDDPMEAFLRAQYGRPAATATPN